MGFLQDVRRGARVVAREAETRAQLAMKHAEAANLRGAVQEALAEAGRELYQAYETERGGGAQPDRVALSERARSLFEEARRLEDELRRLREDMDRLRRDSMFSKEAPPQDGEAAGAPRP